MNASVIDFAVVRNWMCQGYSLHDAVDASAQYVRHRIAVADKIATGRLGGIASKGRPRRCGICRECGHQRGACPQRDKYLRSPTIRGAIDGLRRVADDLGGDVRSETAGRSANICGHHARQLAELAIELQRFERSAPEAEAQS